jgi:beta-lactam-binding protein with PASTA domain
MAFDVNVILEASQEVDANNVIRTDPEGGTEAEVGSTIDVYVSSGSEETQVPPLIGQTLANAETLLAAAGLVLGEVTERPDAEFAEGVVVEQNPSSGLIPVGTPVDLVVSTGPELVEIPELEGITEREATALLQELGLRVAVDDEFSNEVADGRVIRSEPEAGVEAQTGDTILLVVSQGPEPIETPNLTGLTQQQAADLLNDLGLVLNVSAATEPVDNEAPLPPPEGWGEYRRRRSRGGGLVPTNAGWPRLLSTWRVSCPLTSALLRRAQEPFPHSAPPLGEQLFRPSDVPLEQTSGTR